MVFSGCSNHLYILLNLYPDIEVSQLSKHPCITWDIIQAHPEKSWNWEFISMNSNITWEIIQSNPIMPWDWHFISMNPNITWEIIHENPDKAWNLNNALGHLNITWSTIEQYLGKPRTFQCIINNQNIMAELFHEFMDMDIPDNSSRFWTLLSKNPKISWDMIQKHIDKPWDWHELSASFKITWGIIQLNTDKPWDWSNLSRNPNITWDIIQSNPDKNWNYEMVSTNPNITWEIMNNHYDRFLNYSSSTWMYMCSNPNLTWDNIRTIIQNIPTNMHNFMDLNYIYKYFLNKFPSITKELKGCGFINKKDLCYLTNIHYVLSDNKFDRTNAQKVIARTWRRRQKYKLIISILGNKYKLGYHIQNLITHNCLKKY